MIIKDEESIEQALQMLAAAPEGVRYDDRYAYIIITTPKTLEEQCRRALARGEIAIVVLLGREREMENYSQSLTKVRKQRVAEEQREIREWIKKNPEIAKASAEEIPQIVRRMRKKEKLC